MQITMDQHSGVLAYAENWSEYPVVGWIQEVRGDGALVVYPLVLGRGLLMVLREGETKYAVVGAGSARWVRAINSHSVSG